MVAESVCGRIDLGPVGPPTHQSFPHKKQSQVTDFHVPVSPRGGMGNGLVLEGNVGIRLPSVPSGPQSEDESGTSRDHSSSTVVAKMCFVTQLARIEHGARPRALPLLEKLLMQPKSVVYHQNLQVLQLHAWRLSLKALDLLDSRRTRLKELLVANFDSLP